VAAMGAVTDALTDALADPLMVIELSEEIA
jgi:hypothetical protein